MRPVATISSQRQTPASRRTRMTSASTGPTCACGSAITTRSPLAFSALDIDPPRAPGRSPARAADQNTGSWPILFSAALRASIQALVKAALSSGGLLLRKSAQADGERVLPLEELLIVRFVLGLPDAGFLQRPHGTFVIRDHPSQILPVEREAGRARRRVLVGVVARDHRLGDAVDQVGRLRRVGHEDRIRIGRKLDRSALRDARAARRLVRIVVRADLVQPRPAFLVGGRRRRIDDAARRGLDFLHLARNGRGDGGVDVVVDHALPHRAVAGELDQLHVVPGQPAERHHGEGILIERGRADHHADALALEVLDLLDAGVLGDAERDRVAVGRRREAAAAAAAPTPSRANSNTASCAK